MVKGKASSSSSSSSASSFTYPAQRPEDGEDGEEDYSWVCLKTRRGNVSSEHNAKFGHKVQFDVSVGPPKKKPSSIKVSGNTWKIQQEIKSFASEVHVLRVNWIKSERWWIIKLDDNVENDNMNIMHVLVIKIRTFLNACLVAKLVYESDARAERFKAAREKKRLVVEEGVKENKLHAECRDERIVALKSWRQIFASSFEGRYSWGQWYNIRQERDYDDSHITICSICNHDQFNYYGSEKWQFDSDHPPTTAFLENCYHCGRNFFE